MRECHPERWFRIHSLPGSKRYPEDEAEYGELLARHNAASTALFGGGKPVILVFQEHIVPGPGDRPPMELPMDMPGVPRLLRRVDPREPHPHADPAEDMAVDLWALPVEWHAGSFDPLIRSVADDGGPYFLLSTSDAARVYAPYSGGADLFLEDRPARDAWKKRFASWLSTNPDGL